MAWGSANIRVRPIRVAFLVNPTDRAGLYRAIQLSTCMWGGSYNPIIPAFGRTPENWEPHRFRYFPKPAEIISGYLNGFDPDLVVPVGTCAERNFEIGHRDVVAVDELFGDLKESATPRYGIGFIELLNDFLSKELKYKRNDDLHLAIPILPRTYRLFLSAVFGALDEDVSQILDEHFLEVPGITQVRPTLGSFIEFLQPNRMFPRHLSMWSLEKKPNREMVVYVCDATSPLDVIDYWNLRAAGNSVVPIPIQVAENENVKNLAVKIIEDTFRPYRQNPEMYHHTVVQRSRSLSEDKVREFCDSLELSKPEEKNQFKYALRWWYPRLWDDWARENASEGVAFPYSHENEIRISEGEERLELRSSNPNIRIFREYSGKPKFANEFSFRFYSSKEPMAEVFPEGSRELSSAIGRANYPNWRFSRHGPVFMADSEDDLIFLDVPRAETVMTEWFRERGWKVSLSGPGRIAEQLLKQLGGIHGTSWLAHRGIVKLLGDIEKEVGLSRQAVIGRLKQVINDDELHFSSDRFLKNLVDTNALRLGVKVQCPICTRYNWYELNALQYDLLCRFCTSDYKPPLDSPKDIQWSYRAHGPFSASIAQGSFTVLLTLRFLDEGLGTGITPLFSYKAEKDEKQIEADLTCLYKSSTWRDVTTYVVHTECKSFNYFEEKDVSRMKNLSEAFPGSVLVFSTLNDELQDSEKVLIDSLVQEERNKRKEGEVYCPVIILTGIELFSAHGLRHCWEGRGGQYEHFYDNYHHYSELPSLADVTQQLYLGLPSWHQWTEERKTKTPKKKSVARKQKG